MRRLPPPTDPWWVEAPLADVLRTPSAADGRRDHNHNPWGRQGAPATASEAQARKTRRPMTAQQRERTIALIREDMAYAEIAYKVGIGQSSVERIAAQEGIGRGRGRPKGGPTCAVPGCGTQLFGQNKTGVCTPHYHAAGYCRCPRCGGKA